MSKKFYLSVGTFFILFWYSLFSFFERKEPVSLETREDLLSLQQQIDVLKRLVKYEADTLAEAKSRLRELKTEQKSRGDRLHVQVHEDRSWKEPIPILVFVCNRPGAVKTHVEKLLRLRPSAERFPIIVSQDCDNDEVKNAVLAFGDQIEYVKHVSGEKANIKVPPQHSQWVTYYRIARHYKLALDHVFLDRKYTTVVITEDDLDVSPDFFEYFSATRYLLDSDPLLWCVSAWNDNGKVGNIDSLASSKLYRSDFFPGLGWMMNKKTWEEIGLIWPTGFWDDWMRDPARRKGRQCIRPEISRTGMTPDGAVGASKGQFFRTHLAKILVNRSPVNFTKTNLDYLLQKNYDPAFEEEVFRKSKLINIEQVGSYTLDPQNRNTSIRVEYNGNIDYIRKADKLHIMHDFKAGVPRTAYKGVVSCYLNGVRIYLAPDRNIIKGYDSQWEVPVQFGD